MCTTRGYDLSEKSVPWRGNIFQYGFIISECSSYWVEVNWKAQRQLCFLFSPTVQKINGGNGKEERAILWTDKLGKSCKVLVLNARCLELIAYHRLSMFIQQCFSVLLYTKLPDTQFIVPAVPVKHQKKISKKPHVFNFVYFNYFPVSMVSTTIFKDCKMSQMGFCRGKWRSGIQQFLSDQIGSFTVLSIPITVKINSWLSHWIKRAKTSTWYKKDYELTANYFRRKQYAMNSKTNKQKRQRFHTFHSIYLTYRSLYSHS